MQYPHLIEQHAEMLPFLWSQRTALADDETTAIADLNRFDLRVQGNQDGLRLAGHVAFPILEHTWSQPSPGVVFGRATVALAAGDMEQFAQLTMLPGARSPLVSALGFAEPGAAANALGLLAARDDLPSRQIAARGHRALRLAAGLASLISDPDLSVQGPAIEAAGLARSVDEAALSALHHAVHAGGFDPHWALWLISRDPSHLEAMLEMPDVDPARAALAARLAPPSLLAGWISAHQRHSPALAIELTAALGLVEHLGWLGEVLEDPRYCAQAAQALRRVTGARRISKWRANWPKPKRSYRRAASYADGSKPTPDVSSGKSDIWPARVSRPGQSAPNSAMGNRVSVYRLHSRRRPG